MLIGSNLSEIKYAFLLFCGILIHNFLSAQIIVVSDNAHEKELYQMKVSQVNQFISRFNYETDLRNEPINMDFKSKISRRKYLGFLFNLADSRLNSDSNSFSESYKKLQADFINQVVDKEILLDKTCKGFVSEINCPLFFKGKSYYVKILLIKQFTDDASEWVIYRVSSGLFEINNSEQKKCLPPNSHELNFIELQKASKDLDNLQDYFSMNFKYNQESVFLFLLYSGLIKLGPVKSQVFYILSVDGWAIKVREFNRNTENSGWLIDDLLKNELSVEKYCDLILNNGN
jgi:hypothetical protein